MYETILEMLKKAETNYQIYDCIKDLLTTLATTYNAPSDWRNIGEQLEQKYKNEGDNFVYNRLELWEYADSFDDEDMEY